MLMQARSAGSVSFSKRRKLKEARVTAKLAECLGTSLGIATKVSTSGLRVEKLREERSSSEESDSDAPTPGASSTGAV